MTEASASEDVEVWELSPSGTDDAGERGRKGFMSRLISRSNEKSDVPIQDTIYVGSRNNLPNAGVSAYKLN